MQPARASRRPSLDCADRATGTANDAFLPGRVSKRQARRDSLMAPLGLKMLRQVNNLNFSYKTETKTPFSGLILTGRTSIIRAAICSLINQTVYPTHTLLVLENPHDSYRS